MQNPNEDTEWNDALRKHGIIGARQPTAEEQTLADAEDVLASAAARVQARQNVTEADSLDDIDARLDEAVADDEEEALRRYREKRMAEMKAAAAEPQFGEVVNITATEYVREVNEAPKGVWVVLLLYNTALPVCRRLQQIVAILACKHTGTKFVQSIGQNCIPNYPDRNLPTVFLYRDGELMTQFVGPKVFGGESMSVPGVEWELAQQGALKTDLQEPPGAAPKSASPLGVSLSASTRRVLERDRASRRESDESDDE